MRGTAVLYSGNIRSLYWRSCGDVSGVSTTDKPCHDAARRGEPALWRIVGEVDRSRLVSEEIIKVEDVLERVVAEVAKSLPVLLIVMDEMSTLFFMNGSRRYQTVAGWKLRLKGRHGQCPDRCASFNRWMFHGQVCFARCSTEGTGIDETAGFESNEELPKASRMKLPISFTRTASQNRAAMTGRQSATGVDFGETKDHRRSSQCS